jgi:hypothetical protein
LLICTKANLEGGTKEKMIAKIHNNQGKMIIALCDSDILGKKFEEKEFILDLSSAFFKGKEATKEQLIPYLTKAYVINAAGKDSVGFLIENNMANKKDIKFVEKIPHVQSVNMAI